MVLLRRLFTFGAVAVATAAVTFVLVSVFERRQEGRATFLRMGPIAAQDPDARAWASNFPSEHGRYMLTMDSATAAEYARLGKYGGSDAFQKLERDPALTRLFAGNAFAVDYREERGHMRALEDMLATKRLGDAKPGSCMTCKSAQVPTIMAQIGAEQFYATPVKELVEKYGITHSITCAECHNSETMALQVNRPAFIEAMRERGIDVAKASRQEMRTYVCAQCHVEYYFRGQNKTVVFPWKNGLTVDDIERYYTDIGGFADFTHADTGAQILKMQHPEFETYSTGIHARAGVACADCHMPYRREGAVKVTDHLLNTPLDKITTACASCHRASEQEMRSRVLEIQDRTYAQMRRAEDALVAAIDGIKAARDAGVPGAQLAEAQALHRRAQMRWDFVSAENSMGFHSPQEAVRVLGDATDFARQAQLAAYRAQTALALDAAGAAGPRGAGAGGEAS